MEPEHEVVHLRHDLRSLEAQSKFKAAQVASLLEIALEALECDRPHVAKEKIEIALERLDKIGPLS